MKTIEIVGAGPAGLTAALTVVNGGGRAIVYEGNADVGHRFHGDFQGLENWTTSGDVLEELTSLGIKTDFEYTAFHECVYYDARGREYIVRTDRPLWYQVRRGPAPGTLDHALKMQALAAGVEFRFDTAQRHLSAGGIVSHGPHRVDAIALGYVFATDHADGAFSVLSDKLAPKGYSYLLISGGQGTIASCLFTDFHDDKRYLERTVDFFQKKTGLEMRNCRPFGGFGNLFSEHSTRKGKMLYIGEAAGFQDALFGFGMRYAILSGHLAARALLEGSPEAYAPLCAERFGGLLKQAVVNRYFYEKLGDRGYAELLRRISKAPDARDWMRKHYGFGWLKRWFYPFAYRRVANKTELIVSCREGCDCTWCQCRHATPTGE